MEREQRCLRRSAWVLAGALALAASCSSDQPKLSEEKRLFGLYYSELSCLDGSIYDSRHGAKLSLLHQDATDVLKIQPVYGSPLYVTDYRLPVPELFGLDDHTVQVLHDHLCRAQPIMSA